ncbi:carbohydrate ABC transporter permease [Clostridium oryzae]|uniref:sn-glycerol-3-phosphate transport system permease protein UgpA n=1 Tax=Clostridium oryzae TaxID=1450648 RepID=A0A1V4IHL7_9CLOT|nr:sugar ABC transporter permease [Clostridium oryzae]OPJ59501.1 sn-glycerol-3-phosphate transport system permease protein UgpA [Clostridium oryzae]
MLKIGKKATEKVEFIVYVLPAMILVSLAIYIPFLMSMFYSLTEWNGIQSNPKFVGFKNFKQIFSGDSDFRNAGLFTLKYCILYIILINVLALLIAVILDKQLKLRNVLRAAFFIPYILSLVIVGFIWKFIFSQGFTALAASTGWGVFKLSWLGDPKLAFTSIVIVSVWQSVGFYVLIYIAGLQSVPYDLIEAATVDGAGPLRRFFQIVLPLLGPSVTTCVFMSLTNSIKVFDVILSLTAGGPGGSTYSLTYDIYKEAFQNNMYGYGSAKAFIMFIIILIVTVIQLKFFKSREVEA